MSDRSKVGHLLTPDEIGAMLRLDRGWDGATPYDAMDEGRQLVVAGALQFAASTMLGQRLQIAAGDDAMHRGMRIIEDEREQCRTDIEARMQATRAPRSKPARRKPKKKPVEDAKP